MGDACVTLLDEASWEFDPQQWLNAIYEHWPTATGQLGGYPNDLAAAVALLPGGDHQLEVVLDPDRQSISFEPLLEEVIAEFVAWWATRLPAYDPPVVFFVGGDVDQSLRLTPDLTTDDVRRFLAALD